MAKKNFVNGQAFIIALTLLAGKKLRPIINLYFSLLYFLIVSDKLSVPCVKNHLYPSRCFNRTLNELRFNFNVPFNI